MTAPLIGPGSAADLDGIVALESDGFADRRWSREAWAEELSSSRAGVFVAREAGRPVGVISLSHAVGTVDLDRVVVRSDRRGAGIGRRLVDRGLDWARAHGASRVLLEVEHDNAAGVALYTACGFAAIGRRAGYYGPGRDALVLERTLREEGAA